MKEESLVLNVVEVARILQLSKNHVYGLLATNQIPHVRAGRRILVPRKRLLAWLGVAEDQQSAEGPTGRVSGQG